ncbi:hypothetical protein P168DRAFT_302058 [Aspergillus campestris IBT 28561]|uniref:Uncharacterized protein n=1 Tax=Aspergillus campestris (strain IBT 28561) TaxID=1392248 RepID=A0A2I1DB16_ASPC2|nr:uncharacterized protein P168DRAFT_302058 [Aspergillus campestris IBT 28561]PKY07055.1 hypothetical protein P168DRAFT_302058 [Aspergillus campestris IBT 28561]
MDDTKVDEAIKAIRESITFTADTALLYGWCTRKPQKTTSSPLPTPEDTPLPKVKLALQPNPQPEPGSLNPDAQEFTPSSEYRDRSAKPWWYFIDLRGRTVIGEWGLLEEIYSEMTRGNASQYEEPQRTIRGGVWYCVLVPDEVRNIGSAYMLRYTRLVVKWYVRRFERIAKRVERARGFESSEEEVGEVYLGLDEDWDGDGGGLNGGGKVGK